VPEAPFTIRRKLARGELVRLLYRLGHQAASGVLTLSVRAARGEVFVLRRGHVVVGEGELVRKAVVARLARLLAADDLAVVFEGGVTAYPPGATHQISLTGWARQHLEAQLDGTLAEMLVRELAGIRLCLRKELAPEAIDEADRRMLVAMAQPRRLDQIWPLARTPRFRLLAFIHFLRCVDALEGAGVVAERSGPHRIVDSRRQAALHLLGVEDGADLEAVKRAYRRLARSLHPDLQPEADEQRRRTLERRFAEVTAAYEALI
jgi:DnaJ-domain-containing protein 1